MLTERSGYLSQTGLGLKMFSPETKDTIHFAACRLLRLTGIEVEHEGAAERFSAAGAEVVKKGQAWRVFIPEWLVNDCLASAPKAIILGARNPENDFYLEKGRVGFSTFGEQVKVIDHVTREYRSSVRADARRIYKVVDALPGIVVGSRTVCPNDLVMPLQQAHNFYDALTCTSKHVWMGLTNQDTIDLARRMVVAAVGEERARRRPVNTVVSCPTSPLTMVNMCCLNIIGAAETEIMNVEIMEMCLAGGTSPVTLASAVILTVAEMLGGICLAQISRKGVNTILGTCSTNLDLKLGMSPMASPENAMIASGVAQMAAYYDLPVRTGAGVSDSKIPDSQAGYEFAMNALPLALAGANVIWGSGGVDSGLGFDYAKLLMDHECGRNISFMLKGIEVNNEEMALELIEEVGPGGSFLTHKHTFKRTRNQAKTDLFDRHPFAGWEKNGALTMTERAYKKAAEIIDEHEPLPLEAAVQAELDGLLAEFVAKHG
ncbi:MAG: trimethylamine methyltransferase family protein [Deltaproteobacteria bacterium]|jgi:trimethylamine--corrinoid protein Co-methyltransferase|nr:trimethylamine methyltransferase family protein [Deltaproteobacteria bacterium]